MPTNITNLVVSRNGADHSTGSRGTYYQPGEGEQDGLTLASRHRCPKARDVY
jgi:hypothetical protein